MPGRHATAADLPEAPVLAAWGGRAVIPAALANDTEYGLAATALTCSQQHAARALDELRAGTVRVNAVWGGAPGGAAHPRGAGGQGLGYGPELLDELTAIKVVHLEPGAPRASR